MSLRYGNERVKRGLTHFIIGKGVSAIAGIAAMLIVVRELTVSEFAGYSVLVALVEVFTAISGLGLAHVILRYVPELYAAHRTRELQELILSCIKIRTFILLIALVIGWFYSKLISGWIGLSSLVFAFEAFLVVVAFRTTAHFFSQVLESTLHQSYAQIAFSLSTILRVLGLLALMYFECFSLVNVVWLEAFTDFVSCCVLIVGIYLVARHKDNPDLSHNKENQLDRSSLIKFAWSAYLQHLATLPFGGNTNRLIGGAMFGDHLMAKFGFAQSLYEYIKRYLPTQLLIGLIRPIVVARYTTSRNFSAAADLCEQSFQVNLVLLAGIMSVLLVSGCEILVFISGGKYGATGVSVVILCSLIVFLLFETQRLILELISQMVEHYEILIPNNIFLSLSIFGGIAAFPLIGAAAFPIANTLVLILCNISIMRRLASMGYTYYPNWKATLQCLMILCLSVFSGYIFKHFYANWVVVTLFTMLVFILLFTKLRLSATKQFVHDLVGSNQVVN